MTTFRGQGSHVYNSHKKHLDRYLAEFDFRQNTRAKLGVDDEARAMIAIRGMMGKRLMYKDSFAAAI